MTLPRYYITTQQEIENMKSNSLIFINCKGCNIEFSIQKKAFTSQFKNQSTYRTTCSVACFTRVNTTKIQTNCKTCNKEITKSKKEIEGSKSGFVFCSKSCAAITNNCTSKLKTGKNVINSYCCSQCSNSFTSTENDLNKHNTCSTSCWQEAEMKTKFIKNCLGKGTNKFNLIRQNARNYSKYIYPLKCMLCNYDKHYEVCHVKDLKDFDLNLSVYEVNNKNNLVHLCPNCHWEFDRNLITLEAIVKAQKESSMH